MSVVAAALASGSLVLDALTAHVAETAAPASLRGTSLVLLLCLAAPLVQNHETLVFGRFQRPLLAFLLAVASFVGRHTGGIDVRAAEAFFLILISMSSIGLFCVGGVDEKAKSVSKSVQNDCLTLTSALVFYTSLRLLRVGALVPLEARDYKLIELDFNGTTISERGYAYADDAATAHAIAAGVTGLLVSLLIFWHNSIDDRRLPLAAAALVMFVCALAQTLALGTTITQLNAVFGDAACNGDDCDATEQARRLGIINNGHAQTWLLAAAVASLAASAERVEWIGRFLLGLIGFVFGVIVAWSNCTFEGAGSEYDYALLITIVAIGFGFAFDSVSTSNFVWAVTHLTVFFIGTSERGVATILDPFRFSGFCSAVLSAVYIVLDLLRPCFRGISIYNTTLSYISTSSASISAFSFVIGISLLAAYDGSALQTSFTGERWAVAFVYEVCIPALVNVPLAWLERRHLDSITRPLAWLSAPAIAIAAHAVVVAAARETPVWEVVPWPVLTTAPQAAAITAAAVIFITAK